MAEFVRVCGRGEMKAGEGRCVEVGGRRVALFRKPDGTFCAIEDACNHMGASLSEGAMDGESVLCPWHGARFSLASGAAAGPPARGPLPVYAVRVSGEDVEVAV